MNTFDDMVTRARGRIEHLEAERAQLASEWKRIPRLGAAVALTIPLGALWGWGAVVAVVVATLGLLVTAAYINTVRRVSTEGELRDLRRELRAFEAEAAR